MNIQNKKIAYFIQPCSECFSDEDCEDRGHKKMKVISPISLKWLGKYNLILNENNLERRNSKIIELIIKSDNIIFDLSSYSEDKQYELSVIEKNDTLILKYEKLIKFESSYFENDNELAKEKDFGYLIYDGKKYSWISPYLNQIYSDGKKVKYDLKKEEE